MDPSTELRTGLIERIAQLFAEHGASAYEGARRESVSALEHALQCAQLAEWANADASLVAAALLHDMGHFVAVDSEGDAIDDVHELRALPLLAEGFGAAVVEPVRLHVQAKRYLVATEWAYGARLSPASVHSLQLQGGPMSPDEVQLFETLPFAQAAVMLRRWDDLAKEPRKRTPPLDYYLALLAELQQQPFVDSKIGIGSLSIA
ncbi:HD domain-containing protein [Piscinibacter sp. XHJ-5]|uniref:HD domain-containing protein n=1 Tax=Piscinibacter sp. XHJ-5 TaxID=3037797 RepID=UPI002452ABE6|nr:HD domain-containing protein [Piscinibacter sp. XHJ-5]